MNTLSLCGDYYSAVTVVSNIFVDNFMLDANDAQIKIYLYLLRCIGSGKSVSVGSMADFFNYTEKDIIRALKYWDKKKLLELSFDNEKQLTGIRLCTPICSEAPTAPVEESKSAGMVAACADTKTNTISKVIELPSKPSYSSAQLAAFKKMPEVSNLLFAAEQYLGRTLSVVDMSTILYINDALGLSPDVIEYLIEFCVNNKKKSSHYIEKVALSWVEAGISTLDEAKEFTSDPSKDIKTIFTAFGLKNHTPIGPEMNFIKRWISDYNFSVEIIVEACSRTIMNIHEPSFEYADKILLSWKNNNVNNLSDIEALDEQYKASKKASDKAVAPKKSSSKAGNSNVNSFPSRKYDFAALEQELLSN